MRWFDLLCAKNEAGASICQSCMELNEYRQGIVAVRAGRCAHCKHFSPDPSQLTHYGQQASVGVVVEAEIGECRRAAPALTTPDEIRAWKDRVHPPGVDRPRRFPIVRVVDFCGEYSEEKHT
jgi:hypothetical protein